MAIQQLPDGRWQVYYRRDGKIKREYFGRGPAAEANARARDNELGLRKRRPPSRQHGGPDFSDCADVYIESKNFNDNSRKHIKIRLHANILPILGHIKAFRITDQDLDHYVAQRRYDSVKDSTIRRELTDIKAILNFAAKRRPAMIPYNPIRDYIKPQTDDDIIIPPSQEETSAILQHAAPHLKRALMLSYYTGLRPGAVELLKLTWQDVYWESETILIRSADKGGIRQRQVPLHPDFITILRTWYQDDKHTEPIEKKLKDLLKRLGLPENAKKEQTWAFCENIDTDKLSKEEKKLIKKELNRHPSKPIIHYHGRGIKKIQKSWAGALDRAGITRRIRPYDMRHKFVTDALERGDDIKTLAEIVGSSPKTLMDHYQHVSNEMRRKTIAGIPVLSIQNIPKNENDTQSKNIENG